MFIAHTLAQVPTLANMHVRICLLLLIVPHLAAALSGCAANPVSSQNATPPGFSIDLTILRGRADHAALRQRLEPHERQSRYVLFPDGRLHHGTHPQRGAQWLPPLVRTLNQRDVAQLWALAEQNGYTDADEAQMPTNFATVTAQSNELVYLIALTDDNRRWAFTHRVTQQQPDLDPGLVALIHRLAELAWMQDEVHALPPLPQRYDFGPDPYAQYR